MENKYEKMWSEMIRLIHEGDGLGAKKIWDEVVEDAWKYNDLND